MMTKNQMNEREQLEMLTIEQLVPQDHLVRKLDATIDFSFIYPLVEDLYSTIGRPSIDPVVLIKMTFIQYTFGIRSMRQTIKEIETNVAYRWFL
ncbi:transposase, partial [Sporosarcina obsidiansis]|uniref:transposase n=1 Tax=Sporosarcina obsidiansis TaxID=2660748 RepID=UPI001891217A